MHSISKMIIFLNGPSSSGKTSIAKCIQEKYRKPLIHIGIFVFMDLIHSNFKGVKDKKTSLGFYFTPKTINGNKVYSFNVGPYGEKIIKLAFKCMKLLSKGEIGLVVEEVISTEKGFANYLSIFKNQKVYFVGVKCPLKVIEEREKKRGNRICGQSRAVFSRVHPKKREYDIEIDTSKFSPEQCADMILDYIVENPKPGAWNKLYRKDL